MPGHAPRTRDSPSNSPTQTADRDEHPRASQQRATADARPHQEGTSCGKAPTSLTWARTRANRGAAVQLRADRTVISGEIAVAHVHVIKVLTRNGPRSWGCRRSSKGAGLPS